MKVTQLILLLTFFLNHLAHGQTWEGKIENGMIIVTDQQQQFNWLGAPAFKIEYKMLGDCYAWATGKLDPGDYYEFPLQPELEDGFLIQKIKWYGFDDGSGGLYWTNQTSECYDRVLPFCSTGATDTLYLQPLLVKFQVVPGTPEWSYVQVIDNDVYLIPTPKMPTDAKIDTELITNQMGIPVQSTGLSSGWYNYFVLYEWQAMYFVQEHQFIVP